MLPTLKNRTSSIFESLEPISLVTGSCSGTFRVLWKSHSLSNTRTSILKLTLYWTVYVSCPPPRTWKLWSPIPSTRLSIPWEAFKFSSPSSLNSTYPVIVRKRKILTCGKFPWEGLNYLRCLPMRRRYSYVPIIYWLKNTQHCFLVNLGWGVRSIW